jgi:hypothetical protein
LLGQPIQLFPPSFHIPYLISGSACLNRAPYCNVQGDPRVVNSPKLPSTTKTIDVDVSQSLSAFEVVTGGGIVGWGGLLSGRVGGIFHRTRCAPKYNVYVHHLLGNDTAMCGTTLFLPCRTLAYAIVNPVGDITNGAHFNYYLSYGTHMITGGTAIALRYASVTIQLDPATPGFVEGTNLRATIHCGSSSCFEIEQSSVQMRYLKMINSNGAVIVRPNVARSLFQYVDFEGATGDESALGAAIAATFGSEVSIENCTFTDGSTIASDGAGVAIQAIQATVAIINCVFRRNTAITGGAIFGLSSDITISSCTFDSNAANYGGSIFVHGGSLSLTKSIFIADTAYQRGGSVYLEVITSVLISGSTFAQGLALAGGALAATQSSATISTSSFNGNIATFGGRGGAFYMEQSTTLSLIGCTFDSNKATATTSDSGQGGAIACASSSTLALISTTFAHNSAGDINSRGGAIVSSDCDVTITSTHFDSNNATLGGAIFAIRGGTIIGTSSINGSSTFLTNVATNGGCLYLFNSIWNITSTIFTANHAIQSGSTVFADLKYPYDFGGSSNTFVSNTAAYATDNQIATSPYSLQLLSTPNSIEQTSGSPIVPYFDIGIFDYFGRQITTSNGLQITAVATDATASLSGSTILTSTSGHVEFTFANNTANLPLTLLAGSSGTGAAYTIQFSAVVTLSLDPSLSPPPPTVEHTIYLRACEAGEEIRSSRCTLCLAGFYSNVTQSLACSACVPGRFSSSVGVTECHSCDQGKYQDSKSSLSCVLCPAGRYEPRNGSSSCLPCPAGSGQADIGESSCDNCEPGKYQNNEGKIECLPCAAGSYSTNGGQQCQRCDVGFYIDTTGASECKKCSNGTYAISTGRASCQACPGILIVFSLAQRPRHPVDHLCMCMDSW